MVAIIEDALSFSHLHDAVQCVQNAGAGAVVTFHGTVRNSSGSHIVEYLEYEAYQPMAQRELQRIVAQAETQFGARCAAIHRVGRVLAGQTSVVIAASSPHRAQAFEACRWVMDEIKTSVPIWKKEVAQSGAWWVEDPLGKTSVEDPLRKTDNE